MPTVLTVGRWYTRTRNSQLYNLFLQQTKEISLSKIRQTKKISLPKTPEQYRGNSKDLSIIFFQYIFSLFIYSIDYNSLNIYN
jgi:hypothetical protein